MFRKILTFLTLLGLLNLQGCSSAIWTKADRLADAQLKRQKGAIITQVVTPTDTVNFLQPGGSYSKETDRISGLRPDSTIADLPIAQVLSLTLEERDADSVKKVRILPSGVLYGPLAYLSTPPIFAVALDSTRSSTVRFAGNSGRLLPFNRSITGINQFGDTLTYSLSDVHSVHSIDSHAGAFGIVILAAFLVLGLNAAMNGMFEGEDLL